MSWIPNNCCLIDSVRENQRTDKFSDHDLEEYSIHL